MISIHSFHNLERVLPAHLESMLSEKDQLLNRAPPSTLIEIHNAGENRLFVDRGLSLMAARSGVPVSSLATISAILFPVLIVSAIPLLVFASWQISIFAVVSGIISFKSARHFTKEDIAQAAIRNPQLLRVLMSKGVVWFESN